MRTDMPQRKLASEEKSITRLTVLNLQSRLTTYASGHKQAMTTNCYLREGSMEEKQEKSRGKAANTILFHVRNKQKSFFFHSIPYF